MKQIFNLSNKVFHPIIMVVILLMCSANLVAKDALSSALPPLAPQFGQTEVTITLKDYQPKSRIRFSCFNGLFRGGPYNIKPQPKDDGTYEFSISENLYLPVNASLRIGKQSYSLILVPNGKLRLIIDSKSVHYDGDHAALNQEFSTISMWTNLSNGTFTEDIYGMTPLTYKEYVNHKYASDLKNINKSHTSKACKTYAKAILDMNYISTLNSVKFNLYMSNQIKKDTISQNNKIDIDSTSYFKEIKKMTILSSDYQRYYPYLIDFANSWIYQYMKPDAFLQNLAKARKYTQKLSVKNIFNPIPSSSLSEEDLQSLQTEITNEPIRQLLLARNEQVRLKIKANEEAANALRREAKNNGKFSIVDIDKDLPAEKIIEKLIAPYKGKVILIDFWNTWCSPCRNAMNQIKPLKEEMKDVIYLYIANESSPIDKWNEMIPEIDGVHTRISSKQSNLLYKLYQFDAIPTYIIINKEGNKTYQKTAFPGIHILKRELEKASK